MLALSTFTDGSGMVRDEDGRTIPGWRDIERLAAEVFGGHAVENKGIFDVILRGERGEDYGLSLKSKELARSTAIRDLDADGRVYMELANSPAKFWKALREKGASEEDYRGGRKAELIGRTVIETVESWHREAATLHERGRRLDLERSVFLVLSYSPRRPGQERSYQWHAFDLAFPSGIKWEFQSEKLLRGYDPKQRAEALIDWYGLSGGQLKYYPRARDARFSSKQFRLKQAPELRILSKAERYWPEAYRNATPTRA